MVKGRRYRYIYFRFSPVISEQEVEQVIKQIRMHARHDQIDGFPQRIRLLQKGGSWGIVRCAHADKAYVLSKLNAEDVVVGKKKVRMETIGCSGTIRVLRKRYLLPKLKNSKVV